MDKRMKMSWHSAQNSRDAGVNAYQDKRRVIMILLKCASKQSKYEETNPAAVCYYTCNMVHEIIKILLNVDIHNSMTAY
jgi:hypothetical protein